MKVCSKMMIEVICMAIISKENLLKVLSSFNPWWKTGIVNPRLAKSYKRFSYYEAMQILQDKNIRRTVILTGTRRVGKTTIQYQMIEELLKQGVPPQKIVFISMDHPVLKLSAINDILECYQENIYPEQDVYYFFDEIQYAQDWDKWLKIIYDMQPDTRMVATGSASPVLVKGSQESGVGRWLTVKVPTLSFYEYCELLNIEKPDLLIDFKIADIAVENQQQRTLLMLQLSKVQNHFNRYLLVGGFPELALADNDILAQQIMRDDVVDKVLKRDLPALYKIRNVTELERIFIYLCNVSSEVVSIEAIAKELSGVSRPTVENYIQYLESANLIYQSWPVNIDGKKILKASPKIYIADAAIRNAVLMDDGVLADPVQMGKIVETAVYKHIITFYNNQTKGAKVGYYRGGKNTKEIDIVVQYAKIGNTLIEVKYREGAPVGVDDAIIQFSDNALNSVIVTKNADDFGTHNTPSGKTILRIPAFAFLYILGHIEKQTQLNIK